VGKRPQPLAAEWRAGALNNRALSLLDLAKPQEALDVFGQALLAEPGHLECLYNRGLLLWRRGSLTDQALQAVLKDASAHLGKTDRGSYLMGLVHLERGDSDAAVKSLKTACGKGQPPPEAKIALDQARGLAQTSVTTRVFEGHTQGVVSMALSADDGITTPP
jgi:tetratricopeptide (TPR) repeat protein